MRRVLDASAVIAALRNESGADKVDFEGTTALMSAVNLSEVAGVLALTGGAEADIRAILAAMACVVIPLDDEVAIQAGLMRPSTDKYGLSLADRICLALARKVDAPVLTADRAWTKVADLVGVTVQVIR